MEAKLKSLPAPVLILWGAADTFFPLPLAHWLRDNLPNVKGFVELEGGKLFFPDEHPDWLIRHLRDF